MMQLLFNGNSTTHDIVTVQCTIPDNCQIATIEQAEAIASKYWDIEDEFVYCPDMFLIDCEFSEFEIDDVNAFVQDLKNHGFDGAIVPNYDGGMADNLVMFDAKNIHVERVYKRERA